MLIKFLLKLESRVQIIFEVKEFDLFNLLEDSLVENKPEFAELMLNFPTS